MLEISFESMAPTTQAEFFDFVQEHERWDLNHRELLNGRAVMYPPAGYPHGTMGSRVHRWLWAFVDPRQLGEVFDSSQGFELPSGDTVEPDACLVSRERWATAPKPEEGKFLKVVPELVVEIASQATASRDRGEKKAIYERNGVREYWILDWRTLEVTVFHLGGGRFDAGTVFPDGTKAISAILPGLELDLRTLIPD